MGLKKQFEKLIDVKSIVTIFLTLVVVYLAIVGRFDIKDIYIVIISFYFGTQYAKGERKNND